MRRRNRLLPKTLVRSPTMAGRTSSSTSSVEKASTSSLHARSSSLCGASGCSIHSARAGTAVKMASALGCLPDEVTVVGVQPREMGWGTGLSPEVASAVPRVVKAVLDNLGS